MRAVEGYSSKKYAVGYMVLLPSTYLGKGDGDGNPPSIHCTFEEILKKQSVDISAEPDIKGGPTRSRLAESLSLRSTIVLRQSLPYGISLTREYVDLDSYSKTSSAN